MFSQTLAKQINLMWRYVVVGELCILQSDISRGAVQCNVIQPWKCLVQWNLMQQWDEYFDQLTSLLPLSYLHIL